MLHVVEAKKPTEIVQVEIKSAFFLRKSLRRTAPRGVPMLVRPRAPSE